MDAVWNIIAQRNMGKRFSTSDIGLLAIAVAVIANSCGDHFRDEHMDRIEECLIDVDKRLTEIEQSPCMDDSLLVRNMQCINESLYEIKKMKR